MCHWITSFSCCGLLVGACRPPERDAPGLFQEIPSIAAEEKGLWPDSLLKLPEGSAAGGESAIHDRQPPTVAPIEGGA